MSEIRYYKGVHRVRVATQSEAYFIVEALEDFEDQNDDKRVQVKKGDRRIVPVETLFKRKTLPPMVKEHAYELKMEKKLMQLLTSEKPRDNKPSNIET
jgi:hypothetical protein